MWLWSWRCRGEAGLKQSKVFPLQACLHYENGKKGLDNETGCLYSSVVPREHPVHPPPTLNLLLVAPIA